LKHFFYSHPTTILHSSQMLSFDTRNRLADILLAIGDGERQIEIVRQILCEQIDFEPYAAFKRIDRLRKGTIDAADICQFLSDNKVYYTENNCRAFIKRYDVDGDNELVYNEFLFAVLPMDNPTLRTIATQRPNYDVEADQLLSYDIEYSLAKVIDREIAFYMHLDYAKVGLVNCYDFNYIDAFNAIDRFSTGVIDYNNLEEYFRRLGIYPNEDEMVAILRRLDRDDDGRINFDEFSLGLEPVDSLLKVGVDKPKLSMTQTQSPIRSRVYSPLRSASITHDFGATVPLRRNASPVRRAASPYRSEILNRTASPIRTTSPLRNLSPSYRRVASPARSIISPTRRIASPLRTIVREHSIESRRPASPARRVASPVRTHTRSPVRYAKTASLQGSVKKTSFANPERAASPAKFGQDSQSVFRSTASSLMKVASPRIQSKASSLGFKSQASPLRRTQLSSGGFSKSPSKYASLRKPAASGTSFKSTISPAKFLSEKKETKKVHAFEATEAKDSLIEVMKQFIQIEKELEIGKQDLALRPDFNLLDFFRLFDLEGRGSISSSELADGMKKFGIYPNKEELYLLLRRFDKDNDGKLKFSDFTEALTCKQQEYANLLNNRIPVNADLSLNIEQAFSEETKKAIGRVLRMHLDNEGTTESLRQRLARRVNFNVHEAFSYLDSNEDGVISAEELGEILDKNDFYATQRELRLLMDRLDVNRDGKITYSEFVQEMTPKSEKAF